MKFTMDVTPIRQTYNGDSIRMGTARYIIESDQDLAYLGQPTRNMTPQIRLYPSPEGVQFEVIITAYDPALQPQLPQVLG